MNIFGYFSCCIYILIKIAVPLFSDSLPLAISAEAAILINAKTGKVLYEKNAHVTAYPASTTKIATALFTLHECSSDLNRILTADRESVASISPQAKRQSNYRSPSYWLETDGTHVGIKRGEEFRLYDLLHAMLIASANDAANVIAHQLGGTIPNFMEKLNTYLGQIGCKNTHFNNPHGLHHPEHFTTAHDLALITQQAMKDSVFRQIVATVRYTCPQTNLELERPLVQSNHLLRKGAYYYEKAIGVKTGFTQTAGKNLVAAARQGDRELIAVALGYKGARAELYHDVKKMFEEAFQEPLMRRTLLQAGEQKICKLIDCGTQPLKTYLHSALTYDFYPSEEVPVKAAVAWSIPPLPISKGSCVGKIRVVDDKGTIFAQAPLYALEDVKPSLGYRLRHYVLDGGRKTAFFVCAGVLLLFLWIMRKKTTKSRSRRFS